MRRKRRAALGYWFLAAAIVAAFGLFWFGTSKMPRDNASAKGDSSGPPFPTAQPGSAPVRSVTQSNVLPSLYRTNSQQTNSQEAPRNSPVSPTAENASVPPLTNRVTETSPDTSYPRPVQNVFEMQVALARLSISSGSIDGLLGPQTHSALRAFQQKQHLPITGELDNATRAALLLAEPSTKFYVVTTNDLSRLQPLSSTWLGKSQQTGLEYETILELVSEKSQANPSLIRRLNPEVVWSNVSACATIAIPSVDVPQTKVRAAFVTISLSDKILQAWDEQTNLLAHFPCSIARQVEKRPVGVLHVSVVAPNPNYTFDPVIFPESAEARELNGKLVLPPGPNNPVGVAWIGLDKTGYGIHGTPNPEQVGRTESHGCFRLANWNAASLVHLITIGTPVYVQP